MSQAILTRLQGELGGSILGTSDFRGDEEVQVAPSDWVTVATFLRDDPETDLGHFIDLTAVDHPEREGARFDVLLIVHSVDKAHRVRVRTAIKDGEELDTLSGVWAGANWAEREVFDMFGIRFKGHPDLRRILMFEEFEGYPLRKDYPIDRVQPLVPYRSVEDIQKLPPFGIEEGQPFARINWEERLQGRDHQVSPAIGVQVGQRRTLSDSEAAQFLKEKLAKQAASSDTAEGSGE